MRGGFNSYFAFWTSSGASEPYGRKRTGRWNSSRCDE